MGETSLVECRWCRTIVSLTAYRTDHGEWGPRCRSIRTLALLKEIDWCIPGPFWAVLEAAGVTRRMPVEYWYWVQLEELDEKTGEVVKRYEQRRLVAFVPTSPKWAHELAKRLTQDKALAARLGYRQRRQLVGDMRPKDALGHARRRWVDVDMPKTMPFEMRVKIIRVAANNAIAREMVYDDPESAAVIIRDSV